jgi:hypothetical protein
VNVPIRVPRGGVEGKAFTPCPAGVHAAVCVDVVDLGMKDTGYPDPKNPAVNRVAHKVRIVWQVAKKMEDGKPFIVSSMYTLSFNEYQGKQSNLLRDVTAWGIDLEDLVDETNEYDVEKLIGRACLLNVVHKKGETATWANVASLMPLPDGMTAPKPTGYVRVQDREATVKAAVDGEELDGDIPF